MTANKLIASNVTLLIEFQYYWLPSLSLTIYGLSYSMFQIINLLWLSGVLLAHTDSHMMPCHRIRVIWSKHSWDFLEHIYNNNIHWYTFIFFFMAIDYFGLYLVYTEMFVFILLVCFWNFWEWLTKLTYTTTAADTHSNQWISLFLPQFSYFICEYERIKVNHTH